MARALSGSARRTGPPQPRTVVFGGVMALCMCVTALPTYALGTLAPFIASDLDLTKAMLGSLTTVLFIVGSVTSPAMGRMVDHLGGYRMLKVSFTMSLIALLGFAVAAAYPVLLAFVAVVGLARALSNPVTNELIFKSGVWGRMGTLMGITKSGAQFSAIFAGAALPPLAAVIGWRAAMGAMACLALLGLIIVPYVVPRDGAGRRRREGTRSPRSIPSSANWLTGYALLMGSGLACVNAYLPLFAFEDVGMSAATAGLVMGVIGVVSVPGRIIWARWSETRANLALPLILIAAGSVAAIPMFMIAGWVGTAPLWFGAVIFGLAASSWISVGMLTIVRISESGGSGRISGRVLAGFYGGFVTSPVVFGYLVDLTGRYYLSWTVVVAVFVAALVLATVWGLRIGSREAFGARGVEGRGG